MFNLIKLYIFSQKSHILISGAISDFYNVQINDFFIMYILSRKLSGQLSSTP